MVITDRLEAPELVRILTDSGLWETPEEVREAVEKMEGFTVIAREGRHIDRAIGDYFIDDREFLAGEVPAQWVAYIDSEAVGRDIRLSGDNGRAVDLLEDPAGRYCRDWRYYVIREE